MKNLTLKKPVTQNNKNGAFAPFFLVNKYQTRNITYPHYFYYTDGRITSVIRYRINDTVLILGLIHDRFHIYVTDGITIQVFLLLRHVLILPIPPLFFIKQKTPP